MRTTLLSLLLCTVLVAGSCGGGGGGDDGGVTLPSGYVRDLDFGVDGATLIDPSADDDLLVEVQTQTDGTIVAVGTASRTVSDHLLVLRAHADGTPDTTFGAGGVFVNGTGLSGRGVAVDEASGKVVVAADDGGDILVTRLLPDGLPDSTFGPSGVRTFNFGGFEAVDSAFLVAGGKIVVAGSLDDEFLVLRILPDGNLDTTFNGKGYQTVSIGTSSCTVWGAAVASDGAVVLAGIAYQGADERFAAARVLPSGALDPSFGTLGTVMHAFAAMTGGFANQVVLKPDGRILLIGHVNDDLAALGLLSNGQVDPAIGERRLSTPESERQPSGAWNVPGDRVLIAGLISGGGLRVWRLLDDGSNDSSFGVGGVQVVDFPGVVYDLARDVDGGLVGAGVWSKQGRLIRFAPQ